MILRNRHKYVKDATVTRFKRFAPELRPELVLIMAYKRQTDGDQMKWSFQYLMVLQMSLVLGRNILTKRRKKTMSLPLSTKRKNIIGTASSITICNKRYFSRKDMIWPSGLDIYVNNVKE
mmetsp:Transcript_5638/g.11524  ORF Transcript_5638/g.11524 Transcript_5638/m.11524 type:complete len:120 (+) Transcript_5638:742-1101(+)